MNLDNDCDEAPDEVSPRLREWLDRALRWYHSPVFIGVLLALGIAVRVIQFLHGRDLWHDEASLALNIQARSYAELLKPLDYEQAAPAGFLVLTKLAVALFGDTNFGIRTVPFAASIVSLFLLWGLARRWVRPSGLPLALGLFVASTSFIDFSANLKQYTSDAAITMVILWCADVVARGVGEKKEHTDGKEHTDEHGLARTNTDGKEISDEKGSGRTAGIGPFILFGVLGAVAVWFSFTAAFVLAGVGACLAGAFLWRRDWKSVGALGLAGAAWVASFGVYFAICLRTASNNDFLLKYWAGSFMPLPPKHLSDLTWFMTAFSGMFADTSLGLIQAGLGVFAFVLGCAVYAMGNRLRLALLLAPIAVTLLASGVHKYPFADRLLMFLAPILLLGMGEGMGFLIERARGRYALVALALLACFSADQGIYAARRCAQPYEMQEITPMMAYLKAHKQSGDTIYVYHYADRAFMYYAERYGFAKGDFMLGIRSMDEPKLYMDDLDKLKGKGRVWVVSVVIYQDKEFNILRTYLDHIGKQVDVLRGRGADLYLYEVK